MLSSSDAPSTPNIKSESPGQTATKRCVKCGESLPLSQFNRRGKCKYYQPLCKPCDKIRKGEWKESNPLRAVLGQSRGNAKRKGLEHDLTLEYLESIDRDECPYLEIPIKFQKSGKGRNNRPIDLKSLDRIDSNRGYVQGNVVFCSWGANSLLSNHSAEQLLAIPLLHRVGLNFMRLLNSTKPTNEN